MPNDFAPHVGHRFTFRAVPAPGVGFDGVVHCEVLDLRPEELLQIAWRSGSLDTTVTWHLVPEGRGTRLFLAHDGFDTADPGQRHAMDILGGGWTGHLRAHLEATLEGMPHGSVSSPHQATRLRQDAETESDDGL
jgi:uncharacterized protein YndB with AHSA1/START domain